MFAHSYARPLTAPNLHGSGACAIDNGGSGTRAIKGPICSVPSVRARYSVQLGGILRVRVRESDKHKGRVLNSSCRLNDSAEHLTFSLLGLILTNLPTWKRGEMGLLEERREEGRRILSDLE